MNSFNLGDLKFTVKGNITPQVKDGVFSIKWDIFTKEEKYSPKLSAVGNNMCDMFIETKENWINFINGTTYQECNHWKDSGCEDAFIVSTNLEPLFVYNKGVARDLILTTDESYTLYFRTWSVKKAATTIQENTRSLSVGNFVETTSTEDNPEWLTGCLVINLNFVKDESLDAFFK